MSEQHLQKYLDQTRAFVLSRSLIAAMEMDLFRLVSQEPCSRDELIQKTGIADSSVAQAFFDTLVAYGYLEEKNGQIGSTDIGTSMLHNLEAISSWNDEMLLYYTSMADLSGVLKTGRYQDTSLAKYWAYKVADDRMKIDGQVVDDYSVLMDASQKQLSQIIAARYDFSGMRHIMDFGGGYGRLAMTLVERFKGLKVTIVDLPAVCKRARPRIENAGLSDRITYLEADFFGDLPKAAADGVLFVRVLHDWHDDQVVKLLGNARGCLKAGGRVIAAEPMLDKSAEGDANLVLTSLMLTLFGGKRRTLQEIGEMMKMAGYKSPACQDLGLSLYRLVYADA
jgi:demethylspheroidene O-methyltransferase